MSPIFQATVVSSRLRRSDGARSRALQHEAAGAVGIFGDAGSEASLAEKCGLLIAGDTGDWNSVQPGDSTYLSINFAGGPNRGQH